MIERIIGGNSIKWRIYFYFAQVQGNSYTVNIDYYCGVSIKGHGDYQCYYPGGQTNADPSEHFTLLSDALGNDSISDIWSFGNIDTRYRKFPMIQIKITFPDDNTSKSANLKYRMWDVRKGYGGYYGWSLPPATGTGN